MSANLEMMEHRWGTRMALDLPSQLLAAGGAVLHVTLGNASLSGAYVHGSVPLPLLSKVWIRPRGRTAWIEACVVRHDAAGMGLEWIEPGVPAVVALLAPAPPARERDLPAPPAWQHPVAVVTSAGAGIVQ